MIFMIIAEEKEKMKLTLNYLIKNRRKNDQDFIVVVVSTILENIYTLT